MRCSLVAWFYSIPWWAASLASNVAIIATEYINRTSPSFGAAISKSWALILFAQVCLFISYNGAPSLLAAWVTFTVGNSFVRLVMASTVLGEPLRLPWAIVAAAFMAAGSYCIKRAT